MMHSKSCKVVLFSSISLLLNMILCAAPLGIEEFLLLSKGDFIVTENESPDFYAKWEAVDIDAKGISYSEYLNSSECKAMDAWNQKLADASRVFHLLQDIKVNPDQWSFLKGITIKEIDFPGIHLPVGVEFQYTSWEGISIRYSEPLSVYGIQALLGSEAHCIDFWHDTERGFFLLILSFWRILLLEISPARPLNWIGTVIFSWIL